MNQSLIEDLRLASQLIEEPRTVIYKALCSRCNGYNRRAQRYGVRSRFKPVVALRLLNASGWRCLYCNCHLSLENATFDHIIPMSRRGKNVASNLVPACCQCNESKNDVQLLNWLDDRKGWLDRFAVRYGDMWAELRLPS